MYRIYLETYMAVVHDCNTNLPLNSIEDFAAAACAAFDARKGEPPMPCVDLQVRIKSLISEERPSAN